MRERERASRGKGGKEGRNRSCLIPLGDVRAIYFHFDLLGRSGQSSAEGH